MGSFDWKSLLRSVAPMLGTAIGGPFGTLAGAAISSVLGCGKDESAISKALQAATPEQLAALQAADQEFRLQMAKLGFENEQALEGLAVDDRKSAREREMVVRDKTPAIGFYAITVGFFGLLVCMLFHVIPQANERVLDVMVGSLGTAWIGAVNYFYGSSRGSQSKDELLFKSTPSEPKP